MKIKDIHKVFLIAWLPVAIFPMLAVYATFGFKEVVLYAIIVLLSICAFFIVGLDAEKTKVGVKAK